MPRIIQTSFQYLPFIISLHRVKLSSSPYLKIDDLLDIRGWEGQYCQIRTKMQDFFLRRIWMQGILGKFWGYKLERKILVQVYI